MMDQHGRAPDILTADDQAFLARPRVGLRTVRPLLAVAAADTSASVV
jgi:hypothetical protein